jgi:hypothetical protein
MTDHGTHKTLNSKKLNELGSEFIHALLETVNLKKNKQTNKNKKQTNKNKKLRTINLQKWL